MSHRIWKSKDACTLASHRSSWQSALRYVEMNPVRARIVKHAEDHRWTSARAHLGLAEPPDWLDCAEFQTHWPTADHWRESLATLTRREIAALRRATRHDAALGSDSFLQKLEQTYDRQLCARPLDRPRKKPAGQQALSDPTPYTAELTAQSG